MMGMVRVRTRAGVVVATVGVLVVMWVPSASAEQATFEYTGGAQEFVVPANVCSVTVDTFGAEGGDAASPNVDTEPTGGLGGQTRATIVVTPGETLAVYVGGRGGDGTFEDGVFGTPLAGGTGGFNGGGTGGSAIGPDEVMSGAGGGGGSDVRRGGTELAHRVVTAAGGGGGGGFSERMPGGTFGSGGAGGAESGEGGDGADAPPAIAPAVEAKGGKVGTTSSGGAGGAGAIPAPPVTGNGGDGADGALGAGGGGGNADDEPATNAGGGGAGGGLYGGGGGGGSIPDIGGSGGGGGAGVSFAETAATGVEFGIGQREGNGFVSIEWDPSVSTCVVAPPRFTG